MSDNHPMCPIENLVLGAVDKDIAESFAQYDSGTFALQLPMQIHMCRYLKTISKQLAVICKKNGAHGANGSSGS